MTDKIVSALRKDKCLVESKKSEIESFQQRGSNNLELQKKCHACDAPFKYTCPRCRNLSCSLSCIQKHKVESNCDGKKQHEDFLPIQDFTSSSLRQDLSFFQNIERAVDNSRRTVEPEKRYNYKDLPPDLVRLSKNARNNGVVLQILSKGMSKRLNNTSRFSPMDDAIIWKVDFHVHCGTNVEGSTEQNFQVSVDWANEKFLLKDIFECSGQTNPSLHTHSVKKGYNQASCWVDARNLENQNASDSSPSNDSSTMAMALNYTTMSGVQEIPGKSKIGCIHSKLESFLKSNRGEYFMLYKAERMGLTDTYFMLNPSEPLLTNLRTVFFVVEYPSIHVVNRDDLENYPIITPQQIKSLRESFRKRKSSDQSHYSARKNELEERNTTQQEIPCARYLKGTCKLGEKCPRKHYEKNELPMCRSIMKGFPCRMGDKCLFSHDPTRAPASSYHKIIKGFQRY